MVLTVPSPPSMHTCMHAVTTTATPISFTLLFQMRRHFHPPLSSLVCVFVRGMLRLLLCELSSGHSCCWGPLAPLVLGGHEGRLAVRGRGHRGVTVNLAEHLDTLAPSHDFVHTETTSYGVYPKCGLDCHSSYTELYIHPALQNLSIGIVLYSSGNSKSINFPNFQANLPSIFSVCTDSEDIQLRKSTGVHSA